jgi:parallel beta-helix repeat protein
MTQAGIVLLTLSIGGSISYAATLTVGQQGTPCPNAQYGAIGDAINAAASGDVIEICPALYAEQLTITKPLTLRGISVQGVGRVLIQPATITPVASLSAAAVITVMNTAGVSIENLAIDAGKNNSSGCAVTLSDIHFYDASGTVANNALTGTQLSDPTTCTALFPGTGFGVFVEKDLATSATFAVSVQSNSISNFSRNGVLVIGMGITADISGNAISGVGPGTGANQFGVFLANGAVANITNNVISQGNCGAIDMNDCENLRSEGVVLRAVGDGTIIDGNTITNVQSGIFVNGANNARITNNVIKNVDVMDGIHVQGGTNSLLTGNRIFNVGPLGPYATNNEEGCGINEITGTGAGGNTIEENTFSDAYCGVAYVSSDWVGSNVYINTLYNSLNEDMYPNSFPTFNEPSASPSSQERISGDYLHLRKFRETLNGSGN